MATEHEIAELTQSIRELTSEVAYIGSQIRRIAFHTCSDHHCTEDHDA